MARVRPSPLRRLAARLVTGPLGFLAAGTVDWLVLACRYLRARVRGRRHDWYAE